MSSVLYFLKSDAWVWVSNLLLAYAITQIVVNKYIIRKHDIKTSYAVHIIDGGNGDRKRWEMEQEAYKYMKTRRYRFIEVLRKIF